MASFWRRTFGLGGNHDDDELPSGGPHYNEQQEIYEENDEMNAQDEREQQQQAIAPPPTNAYVHHASETLPFTSGRNTAVSQSASYETASSDIPEFHIFQPSVEASSDDAVMMGASNHEEEWGGAPHHEEGDGHEQAQHGGIQDSHDNKQRPAPYPVETSATNDSFYSSSSSALSVVAEETPIDISTETSNTSLVAIQEPETTLAIADNRFDFLKNIVPLQSLQDRAMERRVESKQRIHDLECRLAALQAKLAQETMDREAAFAKVMNESLYGPLSRLTDRMTMSPLVERQILLERRLRELQQKMAQHQHVTLPKLLHDELDSQHDNLIREWEPSLRLESSKVDKREGALVRRFETLAGTVARQYAEEVAVRKAQQATLEEQWENPQEQKRCMEFLDRLQVLRAQLNKEREARIEQDNRVQALIAKRIAALKRAFLESVETQ